MVRQLTANSGQPDVTTLAQVTAWVQRLSSGAAVDTDDLAVAYRAAESWVRARCRWATAVDTEADPPETWPPAPADLVQAVNLLTARYLVRRNTPDGVVGMGDLGPVRITISDRDVDSLTAPYRRVVFG